MIVVNEENSISGNNVLQPEYVPYIDQEDKERELRRKAKNKRLKQKKIKDKIKVLRNIILSFIIGITLVGRYCVIYNMQRELNSISTNINELNKENENIRVDLLKYNNIQYIENIAVNKLHMIYPDKGSAVYTDLKKQNVKLIDNKEKETQIKNLWNKLEKMLF